MRTLKDVNTEMYEFIKDRTSFLTSDEEYIVDNLKSPVIDDNEISISYDKATAFKVVQQACDWIDTTDTENALWCAWYSYWYEVALKEFRDKYNDTIEYDACYRAKQIVEDLDYLLKN